MLCVHWVSVQVWGKPVSRYPVIQSVCLQANDLLRSRTKGFEIRWNSQLIDVTQVYMNLLWFENLLLMRLWVWNAYLVLLWNGALAYPRALLYSGGPLFREFWQLTIPLMMPSYIYVYVYDKLFRWRTEISDFAYAFPSMYVFFLVNIFFNFYNEFFFCPHFKHFFSDFCVFKIFF